MTHSTHQRAQIKLNQIKSKFTVEKVYYYGYN